MHEPLVSKTTFNQAQAKLYSRRRRQTAERSPRATTRPYALRGLMRCSLCNRKMQGIFNHGHPHYRCRYPSEYAQSSAIDHHLTVYVREDHILPELDEWIAKVFAPRRLKNTLQAMQQSQQADAATQSGTEAARRIVADCDRRLAQYQAALDAGASPVTVAQWIRQAEADKAVAQQQLITARTAQRSVLTEEQILGMIEDLGDLTDRLLAAPPERKAPVYQAFGLGLVYNTKTQVVTVTSQPASSVYVSECPRGDLNPHAR
ncbi:zinc ribbon domain-containing protein [Streptomyces sp. TRM49041]|uniref:zinc ribbon domain-containing protein n=1 Tax=Streptomyces sp. TRM49041 TaxID=2603216 RepID=UPI0011EF3B29|nr:zinc ribbon domain-containing protein [Streptomyces sp. TRM49041]